MLKLYKFFADCGKMGFLDGIFVAEESDVQKAIGKEVYFGEVLGKHSDILLKIEEFAMIALNLTWIKYIPYLLKSPQKKSHT